VEAEAAFLDEDVWPDTFKQRALRNDFAGALDKKNEKVERAAAETNGSTLLLQPTFCGEEPEGAECE
jgi:hypothetical protein